MTTNFRWFAMSALSKCYISLLVFGLLLLPVSAFGEAARFKKFGQDTGGDAAMLEYCDNGGKGVGYDSTTGFYATTCGNYNWSSVAGGVDGDGISDPAVATTAGGNSWVIDCTGDGTATGTPDEQVVCRYDGEQIKAYSMADMMLAHDASKPGGKIYLPEGIYHDKGCGQDADANANGCPVLPNFPTHLQRRVQAFGGREFVGAGMDLDGPEVNGRTGTWILEDHGNAVDDVACTWLGGGGTFPCDADPADGVTFGGGGTPHWAYRIGGWPSPNICDRDTADSGCVARPDEQEVSLFTYSRSSVITVDVTFDSIYGDVCVDENIAVRGTCADDRSVQCTTNAGFRTGDRTGSCDATDTGTWDLGNCEGFTTAIATDLATTNNMVAILSEAAPTQLGSEATAVYTSEGAVWAIPDSKQGVCNATDAVIRFDPPYSSLNRHELARQGSDFFMTDLTRFDNTGGGFRDINFMPANWIGRDSANNDADCADPGNAPACDELEILAMGGGRAGGVDSVAVWYAGGGDSFSVIDGTPMGFGQTISNSLFSNGLKLISDASGWNFFNNMFQNWDCQSQGCFRFNFSSGSVIRDNVAVSLVTSDAAIKILGHGGLIDGFEFHQGTFTTGVIKLQSQLNSTTIKSIHGYGVQAPLVHIVTANTMENWNIHLEDFNFRGWIPYSANSSRSPAMIVVGDYNANAAYLTGVYRNIHFENFHASTASTATKRPCIVFLGGGTGDESDADNGQNRTVDDYRHELHFKDIALEIAYDDGGGIFKEFCLGNLVDGSNDADPGETDPIWVARGGVPSWENVVLNGVRMPDNIYPSQLAADVPDCDTIIPGAGVETFASTIVRIHDDTTADGTCAHVNGALTGASTFTSLCVCGADGDWEPVTFE